MTNLSDLIERVEAATGPDRELDAGIMAARGTHVLEKRGRDRKAWWYEVGGLHYSRLDPDGGGYFGLPRFTASLDAAMTLAPWDWLNGRSFSFALEHDFGEPRGWGARFDQIFDGGGTILAHGATPALALVAASLRALQEKDIEHG